MCNKMAVLFTSFWWEAWTPSYAQTKSTKYTRKFVFRCQSCHFSACLVTGRMKDMYPYRESVGLDALPPGLAGDRRCGSSISIREMPESRKLSNVLDDTQWTVHFLSGDMIG